MTRQKGILLASTLLLMAAMASAQTQGVTVSVPFSFVAGHQTLPAGDYTVEQNRGQTFAILRSGKGRAIILSATKSDREFEEKSYVLFRRNGTHYFPAEVWREGAGRVLAPGNLERELAPKQTTGKWQESKRDDPVKHKLNFLAVSRWAFFVSHAPGNLPLLSNYISTGLKQAKQRGDYEI